METLLLVTIPIVLSILLLIIVKSMKKRGNKGLDEQLEKLRENGISPTSEYRSQEEIIGIDSNNAKLFIVISNAYVIGSKIIDFSDIIDCELIRDGDIIFKKSTLETAGRTIAGGLLLGGAGAIVGGLSGSTKQLQKINSVALKIIINDLKNPAVTFNFLNSSHLNPVEKKMRIAKAEEWKDRVNVIIDKYHK